MDAIGREKNKIFFYTDQRKCSPSYFEHLGALFAFAKLKNYFLRIDDLDKPASDVELIIYNQLGEQILKKEMPTNAGSYNIHWDGESESGATLPSGVYFYNLKVDDKRETKSMVLLK